jgi:RNA polymerase sigma-70 factor (sigma-E family)
VKVDPLIVAEATVQPDREVAELYERHALGLIRFAFLMLGDRQSAEDVVQEAFLALYKRWDRLRDTARAPGYLRVTVLNGCRMAHRRRVRWLGQLTEDPQQESAEATALAGEEQRELLAAIRQLPPRQREALVLRYYLELTENETAQSMGISRGTVKSATSRALAALGRRMRENS